MKRATQQNTKQAMIGWLMRQSVQLDVPDYYKLMCQDNHCHDLNGECVTFHDEHCDDCHNDCRCLDFEG